MLKPAFRYISYIETAALLESGKPLVIPFGAFEIAELDEVLH